MAGLEATAARPDVAGAQSGGQRRLRLIGDWTVTHADTLERLADRAREGDPVVALDLATIGRVDTVGAIVIDRMRRDLAGAGTGVTLEGARSEQRSLIDTVSRDDVAEVPPSRERGGLMLLEDIGKTMIGAGQDLYIWVAFLGQIMSALGRVALRPASFRMTPFVYHLELVGLRAVTIVALISFLVGAIVAQQSILQLRTFGATIFVADLIGILTLRELGVLLTAIMVAGRSGSAFTAEIGSMKMREEIDALRTMALDPVEVLILPRLLALVVGVTLLTFLATIASLCGGGVVALVYGGISPEIFVARLRGALTMDSFLVGLIKAPFMGLMIALIASIEGMAVQGSAESLGARTTASVVKAIFMVIVMDGIFAMLFSAIGM